MGRCLNHRSHKKTAAPMVGLPSRWTRHPPMSTVADVLAADSRVVLGEAWVRSGACCFVSVWCEGGLEEEWG